MLHVHGFEQKFPSSAGFTGIGIDACQRVQDGKIVVLGEFICALGGLNRVLIDRTGERQGIPCVEVQVARRRLAFVVVSFV